MANMLVAYTNKVLSTPGTLTASSEDTVYPASNLSTRNYTEVWRSTAAGAVAETVVCNFGTAVACTGVALGNVNIRSTATVLIQANATDSWGAPSKSQTVVATSLGGYRRNLFHVFGESWSYQYFRISILDNGNTDGFIEVGNWFLGSPVTLTDNYNAAWSRRLIRTNTELVTEYQQVYCYARDWAWQFDLPWDNIETATVTELRTLEQAVYGNLYPFYLVLDPTTPAEAYYVRISGQFEESRVNANRYAMKLQFTEEPGGLIIPRTL